MQSFQDTATGQYWALDDDVVVTTSDDGLIFRNASGGLLVNVPKTLLPVAEIPEPDPQVNIPQVVSRYQALEAMRLTSHGPRTDRVSVFDAAVALLARPETPAYYRTAWNELESFASDSPTLSAIAYELGISKEAWAELFRFAASLRA